MTELSPVAQAVRNAYHEICEDYIETWLNFNHNRGLAAVLRAAADQVVPELGRPRTADERTLYHEGRLDAVIRHRKHLLDIATELEGQGG
jgi:hypothetical protein